MARAGRLTITAEFIEAHPGTAARTLESLDVAQAAALIHDLPSRITAPLLEAMLPAYAAACLERLPSPYARAVLQRLPAAAGAMALRVMAPAVRGDLLAELPRMRRAALQRLLAYPEETVGAWMTPEMPLVPDTASVEAAVRQCRRWEGSLDGPVYLVDERQRLAGMVHPGDLLRAEGAQPVRALARPAPLALSPRDTLTAARAQLRRRTEPQVPVTDRAGRLLGLLERAAVMRLAGGRPPRSSSTASPGIGADLLAAYWQVVKALANLALGGGGDALPRR